MSSEARTSVRSRFAAALVSFVVLAPAAGAAPELHLGATTGPPNGVVVVPVSLVSDDAAVAARFDVMYDPALLTPGDPLAGPALVDSDHELRSHVVQPGRLRILLLSRTNAVLPAGEIAHVPMTLDAGVVLGPIPLGIDEETAQLVHADAQPAPPTSLVGSAVVAIECAPGDVHPEGGDARVTLADYVQALREVALGASERAVRCADLAPGSSTCDSTTPQHWCPGEPGDGALTLEDALVVRRLVAGAQRVSCDACPAQTVAEPEAPPIPGDVSGNGDLSIDDVVMILRRAVGLETFDAWGDLISDLRPSERDVELEGVQAVVGDGRVNIADVVAALRAAVGLEELAWQRRSLTLSVAAEARFVAFRATVTGVPAWIGEAALPEPCGGDESGLDAAPELWALTCVSDPAERTVSGELAELRYRAPRALEASGLRLSSELVDAQLDEVAVGVTLQ